MNKLKKLVYHLLCNKLTGGIIAFVCKNKIPDLRWKGFIFSLSGAKIDPTIKASVFWGFYESSEIRFAEKYFNGSNDILELGGSCGVVSAHLVAKLGANTRLISVEANSSLAEIWKENTSRHNYNKAGIHLLNYAVHYGADSVSFQLSDNTTESRSVLDSEKGKGSVTLPAITLSKILDRYHLGDYILVSDIEGAEIALLLNETQSLENCKAILIELHPGEYNGIYYSLKALENMIISKGFTIGDNHGPVYYFENSAFSNSKSSQ